MRIIKSMGSIRKLKEEGNISGKFAEHLEDKVKRLKEILEPEQDIEAFSIDRYGIIGLFEEDDLDFVDIGIREPVKEVLPEWIGKISIEDIDYYLIYIVSNNDSVVQIYIPEKLIEGDLLEWLNKQDISDREDGGVNDGKCGMPF